MLWTACVTAPLALIVYIFSVLRLDVARRLPVVVLALLAGGATVAPAQAPPKFSPVFVASDWWRCI